MASFFVPRNVSSASHSSMFFVVEDMLYRAGPTSDGFGPMPTSISVKQNEAVNIFLLEIS